MTESPYIEARGALEAALRDLATLGDRESGPPVADGARSLLKKLSEELFNVVVVGEFKRGKTTFVNALLGAEVLPAAVVPLTSIVTAVTWGEEPRAEVSLLDGRTVGVNVGDLAGYVTERGNPRNRLGVDRAVLYYPADELREGVFLIDTPGVGSVYRHNTEAAYAFVPQSDAAIFLTSADPPISEAERTFLHAIRAEAARMFFVLNKVDYLSQPDRGEALAFTRGVLAETLGSEPPLYAISARQALDAKVDGDRDGVDAAGLTAFERDFHRFLMREKGSAILESVGAQARKLVVDARNALTVEERALQIPLEDLTSRAEQMERVFAQAQGSRDDIRTLLRGEADKLVRVVEEDLATLRREATGQLLRQGQAFVAERQAVRGSGAEAEELIRSSLRARIERWRAEEDRRVGSAFREATARFVEQTNRLIQRTVRLCGELLQIQLASAPAPVGIAAETRFTYSFFEVPTLLESLLPDLSRVLPRGAARKRLLKDIQGRIPDLVDKHCGRLRWDLVQRLDKSRLALERDLDQRLEATVQSLRLGVRQALEERSRSESEVQASLARIEAERRRLEALDAAFELVRDRAKEGAGKR
jgi:GTPase SAR1 family protein